MDSDNTPFTVENLMGILPRKDRRALKTHIRRLRRRSARSDLRRLRLERVKEGLPAWLPEKLDV